MPTIVSRILLAFEMLVLGVLVMPVFFTVAFSPESFGVLVWITFIGSFLLAAYRVAFAFIHKGPGALRTLHEGWWWLGFGGAAYSVLLTTLLATHHWLVRNLDVTVKVSGVFGLLYLIPLGHVWLEMKLRKAPPHAA
jgi:hypothetical protein